MTPSLDSRLAKLERSAASTAQSSPAAPVKRPTVLQFVESLSIEDKDSGRLVPFILWPAQRKALAAMVKEPRLFVLKARQLGLTWLVLALMLYWGAFDGNRLFFIARQSGEDQPTPSTASRHCWPACPTSGGLRSWSTTSCRSSSPTAAATAP